MKKIDVPLKNALKEFLEPNGFKKVREDIHILLR